MACLRAFGWVECATAFRGSKRGPDVRARSIRANKVDKPGLFHA
jgi:hypothetical protein